MIISITNDTKYVLAFDGGLSSLYILHHIHHLNNVEVAYVNTTSHEIDDTVIVPTVLQIGMEYDKTINIINAPWHDNPKKPTRRSFIQKTLNVHYPNHTIIWGQTDQYQILTGLVEILIDVTLPPDSITTYKPLVDVSIEELTKKADELNLSWIEHPEYDIQGIWGLEPLLKNLRENPLLNNKVKRGITEFKRKLRVNFSLSAEIALQMKSNFSTGVYPRHILACLPIEIAVGVLINQCDITHSLKKYQLQAIRDYVSNNSLVGDLDVGGVIIKFEVGHYTLNKKTSP